jgi:hypothetical protein
MSVVESTPNLGVNDVHELPSQASAGAAMFTVSITSTTSSKAGFSARIGPFLSPAALRLGSSHTCQRQQSPVLARRLHLGGT